MVMLDPLFIVFRAPFKILVGLSSHMELEVHFQVHSDGWQNSFPCSGRSEALSSCGLLFSPGLLILGLYASKPVGEHLRTSGKD